MGGSSSGITASIRTVVGSSFWIENCGGVATGISSSSLVTIINRINR